MRYVLDTSAVIAWVVRNNRLIVQRMIEHADDITVSAIVMHELYFGAFNGSRTDRNLADIGAIELPVLAFDEADARAAGEIRAALRRAGTPIGPYDLLIAGQARARNLVVVTGNVGEFERVDGLAVENWTA